jgi:GDP-L-fucose synthase
MREFLYVDDMAEACVYVMNVEQSLYAEYTQPMLSHLNVGTGKDVTIRELAETISDVVGYSGEIVWDSKMPDGTLSKLMDVSRIKSLGWEAKINLREGLEGTYRWFVEQQ